MAAWAGGVLASTIECAQAAAGAPRSAPPPLARDVEEAGVAGRLEELLSYLLLPVLKVMKRDGWGCGAGHAGGGGGGRVVQRCECAWAEKGGGDPETASHL